MKSPAIASEPPRSKSQSRRASEKPDQMKIVEQRPAIFYSNSRMCAGEIARPGTFGPEQGGTVGNFRRHDSSTIPNKRVKNESKAGDEAKLPSLRKQRVSARSTLRA